MLLLCSYLPVILEDMDVNVRSTVVLLSHLSCPPLDRNRGLESTRLHTLPRSNFSLGVLFATCAVLYCTVLYRTVLHCVVLYYAVLHCAVPKRTTEDRHHPGFYLPSPPFSLSPAPHSNSQYLHVCTSCHAQVHMQQVHTRPGRLRGKSKICLTFKW